MALHPPAIRGEVGVQHRGDALAVRGIGKQQVQAAGLDVAVAQEVGHRVDLGAAQPFGWWALAQLRRHFRPVLVGVGPGQRSANGVCLRLTREGGQVGVEQTGADGAEKRVGCGHGGILKRRETAPPEKPRRFCCPGPWRRQDRLPELTTC